MQGRSRFIALCGLLTALVALTGCGATPTPTPVPPARTGPPMVPPGTSAAGLATAAAIGTSPTGSFATPAFVVSPPPGIAPAASPTTGIPTVAPTVAPAVVLAPEVAIAEPGKWFNSEPLTLAKLRGKPVLLVFWSDI